MEHEVIGRPGGTRPSQPRNGRAVVVVGLAGIVVAAVVASLAIAAQPRPPFQPDDIGLELTLARVTTAGEQDEFLAAHGVTDPFSFEAGGTETFVGELRWSPPDNDAATLWVTVHHPDVPRAGRTWAHRGSEGWGGSGPPWGGDDAEVSHPGPAPQVNGEVPGAATDVARAGAGEGDRMVFVSTFSTAPDAEPLDVDDVVVTVTMTYGDHPDERIGWVRELRGQRSESVPAAAG